MGMWCPIFYCTDLDLYGHGLDLGGFEWLAGKGRDPPTDRRLEPERVPLGHPRLRKSPR